MTDTFMGRCGIDCETCSLREESGCPGCTATEGKPFWGECSLAKCCIVKNHEHCGGCNDFPCNLLHKFSYDPEHGDNGKSISNLREWNEMGYDVWRKNISKES